MQAQNAGGLPLSASAEACQASVFMLFQPICLSAAQGSTPPGKESANLSRCQDHFVTLKIDYISISD